MESGDTIYVAGHRGMVGSALIRKLESEGFSNIVTATSSDLDLRDPLQTESFIQKTSPDYVFLAAAKVGGILANSQYPVEFLYDNLMIQNNVIRSSFEHNVQKLIFLGSSCIYPAECPQPMKEDYLLTGLLEPTNEGYALAKIAGIRLAQYYFREYNRECLLPMPCNLYGRKDNFDPTNSHVLAALVKKFVDAKFEREEKVTLWGTGVARREFLHVDDLADAILLLLDRYSSHEIVNVGSGIDIAIKDLANLIAAHTGYEGEIVWDHSKPDGMMRKCLDVSKLSRLGFIPKISLETGIEGTIDEYLAIRSERSP